MRERLRQALFVALAAAVTAAASATEVRLVSPAAGAVLDGGATAIVRWELDGELAEKAEEWEAFLSVDGGRYYGVRITPHLGLATRAFAWRVPNIASADARILIRAGDEHEEESFELPVSFSIRAGRAVLLPVVPPDLRDDDDDEEREAARPDDPPVAEWIDGDRDGGSLSRHVRHEPFSLETRSEVFAAALIDPDPEETPQAVPPLHTLVCMSLAAPPRELLATRTFVIDLFSRLRRLNI